MDTTPASNATSTRNANALAVDVAAAFDSPTLIVAAGGIIASADFEQAVVPVGESGAIDVSTFDTAQNSWSTYSPDNTIIVGKGEVFGTADDTLVTQLSGAELYTNLTVRAGATYSITFDYAPPAASSNSVAYVFWTSYTGTQILATLDSSNAGVQHYSLEVPASVSGAATLEFSGAGGTLDNIVVSQVLDTGVTGQPILLSGITATAGNGSDALSLSVSGLPANAVLTDGTGAHTVSVTAGEAVDITGWNTGNLLLTAPSGFIGTLAATVIVTDEVSGAAASQVLQIAVNPAAYAPVQTDPGNAIDGTPGVAIALPVSVVFPDSGGAELHTLTLNNLPRGAVVTDGTHSYSMTGDGSTLSLLDWDLSKLQITVPEAGYTYLFIRATTTEVDGGDYAESFGGIGLRVASATSPAVALELTGSHTLAHADFQQVALPSSQYTDTSVAAIDSVNSTAWHTDNTAGTVEIGSGLLYGSGADSQVIELEQNAGDAGNLYTSITTMAGASYTVNFDYSARQGAESSSVIHVYWGDHLLATLESAIAGLQHYTLDVPVSANSGIAQLTFQAGDSNGFGGLLDNIAVSQTLDTGLSNHAILLANIGTTLTEGDANLVSLGLAGLPASSVLSDGTAAHTVTVNAGQTVDITGWNTANLLYMAPTDFIGTVTAVVIATAEVNSLFSTASQSFSIVVNPGVDLSVAPADHIIYSNSGGGSTALYSLEGAVYTISFDYQAPAGSGDSPVYVYWTDNNSKHIVGTVDSTAEGLQHYAFQVSAIGGYTSLEFATGTNDGSATAVSNVVVTQNLDTGVTGQPILLSAIDATSLDTGATITLTLSGLPSGSVLSDGAVHNVTVAAGQTIDITDWDRSNLVYRAPGGYAGTITAKVTAVATDSSASTQSSQALQIVVDPAAPKPIQTEPTGILDGATGLAISLPISVVFPDTGGAQLHTLTLGNVPIGAVVTDGTHTFTMTASSPDLSILGWDLAKLQITLPIAAYTTLIVHATTTEVNGGDFAQSTGYINVRAVAASNPAVTLELTHSHTVAHADFEGVGLPSIQYTDPTVAAINSVDSTAWHTSNVYGTVEIGNGLIYGAGDNSNVIELEQNYGNASNLYTTVSTLAGASYTVGFDYSARQGAENNSVIYVYWGELLLATLNSAVTGMQHYSFDVPVSSSSATTQLTFQAADSNGYGGVLDNIAVTQVLDTGLSNHAILLSSISTTFAEASTTLVSLGLTGLPATSVISDGIHTVTVTAGQTVDITGWNTANLQFTAPQDFTGTITAVIIATADDGGLYSYATAAQSLSIVVNAASLDLSSGAVVAAADFEQMPVAVGQSEQVALSTFGLAGEWHSADPSGTVEIGSGSLYGSDDSSQVVRLTVNGASLYTNVSTQLGATYLVSFDYQSDPSQSGNSKLVVYWGDTVLAILDNTTSGMQHYSFEVPEHTEGDTQLTFQAGVVAGPAVLLDNIVVTQLLDTGVTHQPILLSSIDATLADSAATLTLAISGLPATSVITDGTAAHTVTLATGEAVDITGWNTDHLLFTAPADYVGTLAATVVATTVDGSTESSVSQPLDIVVNAAADAPTLTLANSAVSGTEGSAIDLSLTAVFADNDGAQIHTLGLNGLPDGAVLSDGVNTHTVIAGDSTVSILGWNLAALEVTVAEPGSFTVAVIGTATENAGGSTASSYAGVTFDIQTTPQSQASSLGMHSLVADVISFGNTLQGGSGNDVLTPGSGDYGLTGGAGADTFLYSKGTVGNSIIYDFNPGEGDKIDLSHLLQGETDDTLNNYLKITTNDAGTTVLDVSTKGDFTAAGGGAADVTIALVGMSANTTINSLVAGADPAVKVDHHG